MLSVEECKKHIGDLVSTDQEITEIRDLLYAFVEQALDFATETGTLASKKALCTQQKQN